MASVEYYGVTFDNLRKAIYLLFFGVQNGDCNDFDSELYKYIIPMQGNFENPLNTTAEDGDTFIMYWVSEDRSLTQDDYVTDSETGWNRQKCVANVLLRFVGAEAETWAKSMRHLVKRDGVTEIWSGVCNAEKLVFTMPIYPVKTNYFGKGSQIAFDVRFKLYYDEVICTNWERLEGVNMTFKGNLIVDE